MTGKQELERKIIEKTNRFVEKHPGYNTFNGFRYSLMNDDMALSSIYQYITYVNNFLEFCGKKPEELKYDDYNIYLGTISDKSKSYRITSYTALKKYSLYLKANQINGLDPMQYIHRPRKKGDDMVAIKKREKGFLTKSEISKMIDNVYMGVGSHKAKSFQVETKDRDMAIIKIFLSTGMRCSALCKLDLDDIDYENHVLAVTDKGGHPIFHNLPDEAWQDLLCWLTTREDIVHDESNRALFVSRNGNRIHYNSVYNMVKQFGSVNGKHITPHKLRATYGTQLYNATKDIYFVQKCMGHASATTTQTYIRGNNKNSEKAAQIMGNLLK